MSDYDIDFRQMEEFRRTIRQLENDFPREAKKMLTKVGNKAKAIVLKKARQLVKNDSGRGTGRYHRSIKRGKVWDDNGQFVTRIYSKDPKKFIIENGHRIVDKNGQEHGFKQGYKVFERSEPEIEENFNRILAVELNKVMDRLSR